MSSGKKRKKARQETGPENSAISASELASAGELFTLPPSPSPLMPLLADRKLLDEKEARSEHNLTAGAGISAITAGERARSWEIVVQVMDQATGRRGDPDGTLKMRLDAIAPGLADRLGDGLDPDELRRLGPQIAKAMDDAGAAPGTYSFSHGDPEYGSQVVVTGRAPDLQAPGRADRDRLVIGQPDNIRRFRDAAEQEIPAGFRKGAPPAAGSRAKLAQDFSDQAAVIQRLRELAPPGTHGPRQTLQLGAAKILALHADLQHRMAYPSEKLTRYLSTFITHSLSEASQRGGEEAMAERYKGMFYPATDGPELAGLTARMLSRARTYSVSPGMVDEVDRQYEAEGRDWYSIRQDVLPWPAGFAWLDKPTQFTDSYGRTVYNRAVSWDTVTAPAKMTDGTSQNRPHIRVACWSWHEDRDDYADPETGRAMLADNGGLLLGFIRLIPAGGSIKAGEQVTGKQPQSDAIRWMHTLWRTLSSEIAITTPRRPDFSRTDRRRIQRSLKHNEVQVVLLRRPVREPAEDHEHRAIEWSCRWTVQSFYRHVRRAEGYGPHHAVPDEMKTHCITCGAKVSYVAPFVKGPAGLPMKSEQQVYRLAR